MERRNRNATSSKKKTTTRDPYGRSRSHYSEALKYVLSPHNQTPPQSPFNFVRASNASLSVQNQNAPDPRYRPATRESGELQDQRFAQNQGPVPERIVGTPPSNLPDIQRTRSVLRSQLQSPTTRRDQLSSQQQSALQQQLNAAHHGRSDGTDAQIGSSTENAIQIENQGYTPNSFEDKFRAQFSQLRKSTTMTKETIRRLSDSLDQSQSVKLPTSVEMLFLDGNRIEDGQYGIYTDLVRGTSMALRELREVLENREYLFHENVEREPAKPFHKTDFYNAFDKVDKVQNVENDFRKVIESYIPEFRDIEKRNVPEMIRSIENIYESFLFAKKHYEDKLSAFIDFVIRTGYRLDYSQRLGEVKEKEGQVNTRAGELRGFLSAVEPKKFAELNENLRTAILQSARKATKPPAPLTKTNFRENRPESGNSGSNNFLEMGSHQALDDNAVLMENVAFGDHAPGHGFLESHFDNSDFNSLGSEPLNGPSDGESGIIGSSIQTDSKHTSQKKSIPLTTRTVFLQMQANGSVDHVEKSAPSAGVIEGQAPEDGVNEEKVPYGAVSGTVADGFLGVRRQSYAATAPEVPGVAITSASAETQIVPLDAADIVVSAGTPSVELETETPWAKPFSVSYFLSRSDPVTPLEFGCVGCFLLVVAVLVVNVILNLKRREKITLNMQRKDGMAQKELHAGSGLRAMKGEEPITSSAQKVAVGEQKLDQSFLAEVKADDGNP